MRRITLQLCVRIAVVLLFTSISAAATISGRVMNQSTGSPSYGDDVALYRVDRTMQEVQRTTSDPQGKFRFENQRLSRYLIAVTHQGITYHTPAAVITNPVDVAVFDSVPALQGVHVDSDTLFFETDSTSLKVTEFFVLSNQSSPPRTLSAKETYRFALPQHASLTSVMVQPPGTLPLRVDVSHRSSLGQFAIDYPVRPGVTKIRVVYSLPYSGELSITPRVLYPLAAMALMIPGSMHLKEDSPGMFVYQGKHNRTSEYSRSAVSPGASVRFTLSGQAREDGHAAIGSLISRMGSIQADPGIATTPIPNHASTAPQSSLRFLGVKIIATFGSLLAVFVAFSWSATRLRAVSSLAD